MKWTKTQDCVASLCYVACADDARDIALYGL